MFTRSKGFIWFPLRSTIIIIINIIGIVCCCCWSSRFKTGKFGCEFKILCISITISILVGRGEGFKRSKIVAFQLFWLLILFELVIVEAVAKDPNVPNSSSSVPVELEEGGEVAMVVVVLEENVVEGLGVVLENSPRSSCCWLVCS